MATLFELSAEMNELFLAVSGFDDDTEGLAEEEKEKLIADLFARWTENADEIDAKLDGYAAVMAEFEARAEYRAGEAKRLSELASRDSANYQRLKERLLAFFIAQGIKKRETAKHIFTVAKAGGKQALEIEDGVSADDLPATFTTIIPEQVVINKDAIREHLAEGNTLEYARLLERKDTLRIK